MNRFEDEGPLNGVARNRLALLNLIGNRSHNSFFLSKSAGQSPMQTLAVVFDRAESN